MRCSPHILRSIAKRQFSSYLINPVGYLFILVYVVATMGYLLFVREDTFFARNLADLQLLHTFMPWALAILLPVLGMGSWATEREQGTDELLLTMPVSILDAILGKYLAILAFFSLALLICGITAIAVLVWLGGSPDLGLLIANGIGWWLIGAIFAAFSLLASMLVTSQSVAFVLGSLVCVVAALVLQRLQFSEAFDRGILSFSGLVIALVAVSLGLVLAILRLAAQSWRPEAHARVWVQVLTVFCCLGIAINIARIGQRVGIDYDITADGLSSVSSEAIGILEELDTPVNMTVVVTADATLPNEQQLRAKEVLDMARALHRSRPDLLRLNILRPEDRLDEAGSEAVDIHGVQPRRVLGQTVVGAEQLDVFMGASVRAAGEVATIPYFHPGLSVEYELVRAIRSVAQQAAIREIPEVHLTVAVSEDLPESFQEHQQAIIDHLARIAGRSNARIEHSLIEIPQERDAASEGQWLMLESLGLSTHQLRMGALDQEMPSDDEEEQELQLVMAAHAESDGIVRRIPWLGDEEDLAASLDDLIVRVRSEANQIKPVLGILQTDLGINGGFDPQRGQSPPWEIVNEWSQQYEIRSLRPEQLAESERSRIDVLVAALPSSLSEQDLRLLYDWIWAGNPTLLLLDPMPLDAMQRGRFLAPVEAREPSQAQQFGAPPERDPKGDMSKLLRGIGIEWLPDEVLWSRYNPAPSLRFLGPHFVWMQQERDAINTEHPMTTGIDTLMAIYPGIFTSIDDLPHGLQVTPLMRPSRDAEWGVHSYHELVRRDPFPRLAEIGQDIQLHPLRNRLNPMLAAEVRGRVAHAYDPSAALSQDMHVAVIADTDLAASVFFNFYRDVDGQISDSDLAILTSLRNIQFLSNVIDVLMGDTAMTSLRGRRPQHRTLRRMEENFDATQSRVDAVARQADERAESARRAAQDRFDEELAAIDARTDLDRMQKQQLKASVRQAAERRLNTSRADIERQRQAEVDAALRDQRRAIAGDRRRVKLIGVGVPAGLLSLLVIMVFAVRLSREAKKVPAARSRRKL